MRRVTNPSLRLAFRKSESHLEQLLEGEERAPQLGAVGVIQLLWNRDGSECHTSPHKTIHKHTKTHTHTIGQQSKLSLSRSLTLTHIHIYYKNTGSGGGATGVVSSHRIGRTGHRPLGPELHWEKPQALIAEGLEQETQRLQIKQEGNTLCLCVCVSLCVAVRSSRRLTEEVNRKSHHPI